MEKKSILQIREAAFEANYFQKKDAELVRRLKAVFNKAIDRETIRATTGVTDEQVLDRLIDLNLSGEMMAAFELLPIVEVAWADGGGDKKKCRAVLEAAEQYGVVPGSKAYEMLERRLNEGPSQDSRKVWFMYAAELKKTLSPEQLAEFRKDLLDLCNRVAEASGGILGLVLKTSANEHRVIDAVEKALA